MAVGQVAQRGDHEAERELRDRNGVASGRPRDRNPASACGLEIEVVDPDSPLVQEFETSRRAQHIAVHADLSGDCVIGVGDDLLEVFVSARRSMRENHSFGEQLAQPLRRGLADGIENNDRFCHGTRGMVVGGGYGRSIRWKSERRRGRGRRRWRRACRRLASKPLQSACRHPRTRQRSCRRRCA